jgi:hypothetical protein
MVGIKLRYLFRRLTIGSSSSFSSSLLFDITVASSDDEDLVTGSWLLGNDDADHDVPDGVDRLLLLVVVVVATPACGLVKASRPPDGGRSMVWNIIVIISRGVFFLIVIINRTAFRLLCPLSSIDVPTNAMIHVFDLV